MDSISWSDNLSSKLIEIIKTGILLTDTEGRIRFANSLASRLLGVPEDDLHGMPIAAFFLPDDTPILLPNIMKLTRQGSGFEGEALLRRKDGETFFVNLSTTLYKEVGAPYEFMIFAIQDITHLKKIQQECAGSERFAGLGMMTDQISHQIRNPVACIGGFALRLAKDRVSADEYAHYTTIIHGEAKRLEYIIDRLVEFAQVHTARYAALTLGEIMDGARKNGEASQEQDFSRIRFPDPSSLPETVFFGDLPLLVSAVCCVLRNGVEATPEDGEVAVTADMTGEHAVIRIRDNGEGIPPENMPFIFDPFFTTRFNLLGLGLTMAKRIAETHKGFMEVDSTVNAGTHVRIILPRDRRREVRRKLV